MDLLAPHASQMLESIWYHHPHFRLYTDFHPFSLLSTDHQNTASLSYGVQGIE